MIPYKQLSLEDIFSDCEENLKMISLNFSPCSNPISILMRLSRFLSEIIFMHRRAEPVNTPCIPCCPNDPTLPMKYEGTSKLRNDVKF